MTDGGSEEGSSHGDYLREKNLVPPKSYTSKIWKFLDLKQAIQKRNLHFVHCAMLSWKYYRNTTNLFMHFKGQHPLIYAKSELSQQKSAVGELCCSMCCAAHSTDKEDDSQWTLNVTTAVLPASSRWTIDIINTIGYFVAKDMLPMG